MKNQGKHLQNWIYQSKKKSQKGQNMGANFSARKKLGRNEGGPYTDINQEKSIYLKSEDARP